MKLLNDRIIAQFLIQCRLVKVVCLIQMSPLRGFGIKMYLNFYNNAIPSGLNFQNETTIFLT